MKIKYEIFTLSNTRGTESLVDYKISLHSSSKQSLVWLFSQSALATAPTGNVSLKAKSITLVRAAYNVTLLVLNSQFFCLRA